jgi:hypothetical protein
LQFLSKKYKTKFCSFTFFKLLVIKSLDPELYPDPDPELYSDPDPKMDPDAQLEKLLDPDPHPQLEKLLDPDPHPH